MTTRYFVIAAAIRGGGPADLLDHVERKHGTVRSAKLFDAPAKDCVYGVIEYEPRPSAVVMVSVLDSMPVIEQARVTGLLNNDGRPAFWVRGAHTGDRALHLDREGLTWSREIDAEAQKTLLAAWTLIDWAPPEWRNTGKFRVTGDLTAQTGAVVYPDPQDPGAVRLLPPAEGNGRRLGVVLGNDTDGNTYVNLD